MRSHADIYETTLLEFRDHLKLERSMSPNTVSAYLSDVRLYFQNLRDCGVDPADASIDDISRFLEERVEAGVTKRSQARITSSLKALYRFLDAEGRLTDNPCDKLSVPKLNPYLPTVLSVEEVLAILDSVDLSRPEGHRNRAILEVLYSCGLRVSELVNLKISDLFLDEQFIRVFGKGSKQRLVPIGEPAIKAIGLYRQVRDAGPVSKSAEDILFLNRRGSKMTREMVFHIVKEQAEAAGIRKNVSPHTFRHSFATHLVENGADLRVVQEMLGHESILTTEIYTHIDTRKWQETILKYHPSRDLPEN
ncbi:MAG: site-specific tyrosine recombinase XerD [Bacteroidales bacterium]|nr:site-specific tyrosine recombinase XerD [Bacteroidales bacterium]